MPIGESTQHVAFEFTPPSILRPQQMQPVSTVTVKMAKTFSSGAPDYHVEPPLLDRPSLDSVHTRPYHDNITASRLA